MSFVQKYSGGFRGCPSAPPTVHNFFNFIQFFTKFGKIICWRPPGGLASPPTGNPRSATGIYTHLFHEGPKAFTKIHDYLLIG